MPLETSETITALHFDSWTLVTQVFAVVCSSVVIAVVVMMVGGKCGSSTPKNSG